MTWSSRLHSVCDLVMQGSSNPRIPWAISVIVVRKEPIPGLAGTYRDVFPVCSMRSSQYGRCMFPGIGAWDITVVDRGQPWTTRGTHMWGRGTRIENRESRIQNRESRIEDRESRIENRESRIEDQESRIENRESRIEDRGSRIENRESRIENRKSRIQNREWRIGLCQAGSSTK